MYALFPARFRYNNCHKEVVENFSSKQLHSTFRKTAQRLHRSLRAGFVLLAYEFNYGSAANTMPNNMKNELLASLKVDFEQFCASQTKPRKKVQGQICNFQVFRPVLE